MSEFEKAHVLHKLEKNFDIPKDILNKLLNKIQDDNIRNNYSRIQKGLTTEDNYKAIYSAFPWVKNINGIDQEQEKHHKENYQSPDYSMLVEDSGLNKFPILIDVKSVSGGKESCEIMPKQLHALRSYARDHKTPLLFAIYWERLGYWTHTTFKNFGGKKNNKITWKEAISNDLSHILSDYSFVIDANFYRKTIFTKNKPSNHYAIKENVGHFSEIFVGRDLDNLKEYNLIVSSAIDSAFKATEIHREKLDDDRILLIEEFNQPRIVKLSNWIINFINLWKFPPDQKFGDARVTTTARMEMVNLMNDLEFTESYLIPSNKNSETEKFFNLAYKNTSVMRNYLESN